MREVTGMRLSWILFLLSLMALLFADKMDTALHGEKALKKVLLVFGSGTALICALAMAIHFFPALA